MWKRLLSCPPPTDSYSRQDLMEFLRIFYISPLRQPRFPFVISPGLPIEDEDFPVFFNISVGPHAPFFRCYWTGVSDSLVEAFRQKRRHLIDFFLDHSRSGEFYLGELFDSGAGLDLYDYLKEAFIFPWSTCSDGVVGRGPIRTATCQRDLLSFFERSLCPCQTLRSQHSLLWSQIHTNVSIIQNYPSTRIRNCSCVLISSECRDSLCSHCVLQNMAMSQCPRFTHVLPRWLRVRHRMRRHDAKPANRLLVPLHVRRKATSESCWAGHESCLITRSTFNTYLPSKARFGCPFEE